MTKSSFSSWAAGLLLLGTLLFAGTVAAQEPAIGELTRKGEEAYLAKKYKTAVEYFTTAAEQGDAQAQYWGNATTSKEESSATTKRPSTGVRKPPKKE